MPFTASLPPDLGLRFVNLGLSECYFPLGEAALAQAIVAAGITALEADPAFRAEQARLLDQLAT